MEGSRNSEESSGSCEQSFLPTLEDGSQLICMKEDSVVILDTGATANLVCFRRSTQNNSLLSKLGLPRVATSPAQARFKFGGGRMGGARFAADIAVAIASTQGDTFGCGSVSDLRSDTYPICDLRLPFRMRIFQLYCVQEPWQP